MVGPCVLSSRIHRHSLVVISQLLTAVACHPAAVDSSLLLTWELFTSSCSQLILFQHQILLDSHLV